MFNGGFLPPILSFIFMKIRNLEFGFLNSYRYLCPHDDDWSSAAVAAANNLSQLANATAATVATGKGARAARQLQQYMFDKNLAWQEEQFNRIEQYNWDMWNKTNEYNSPSAQVDRFLKAGLNPALLMKQSGSTSANGGNLSPAGQGSPIPSIAMPDNIGTANLFSRAFDSVFQNSLKQQMIESAKLDNQSKSFSVAHQGMQFAASIEQMLAHTKNETQEAVLKGLQSFIMDNSSNALIGQNFANLRATENSADLTSAQTQGQYLNNILTSMHIEAFPREFANKLALMASEMRRNNAQAYESKKHGELYGTQQITELSIQARNYAEAAKAEAEESGITWRNNMNKACEQFYIKTAVYDSYSSEQQWLQQRQDYYNPFHYLGQFLGGGSAPIVKSMLGK